MRRPPARDEARGRPAALEGLRFEPVDRPLVSVVVAAYNCFDETVACLRTVAERTPGGTCELILVDDSSTDEAFGSFSAVPGLSVVRMPVNGGFTLAANAGAAAARGDFIYFLNNDTEVRSGWLRALVETFADPTVGAAGSQLVYPDGSLQEAGGLVWNDGTCQNIGIRQNPFSPEHVFRRDVDYCSAAALLVRTHLFRDIGGFDPLFSPGYYEDADLCFALWSRGYRVVYVPRSVVFHVGGLTYGTDETAGRSTTHTKTSQLVNRYRFAAKWTDELLLHRVAGPVGPLDEGRLPTGAAVLVMADKVPEPDRDSGSLRLHWILRLLVEQGCRVTFVPADGLSRTTYGEDLAALGVEVSAGWLAPPPEELLRARQGLYDLVVLSWPFSAAKFLDPVSVWQPRAVVMYDTVDLHELRLRRRQALPVDRSAPSEAAFERVAQHERLAIARCDLVATVTAEDERVVRQLNPTTQTVVLPNVHAPRGDEPPAYGRRSGLLFIGGYDHFPNVDAVRYLVQDVLPLLEGRLDTAAVLLGSNPPAEVLALRSPSVTVTGYVRETAPHFDRARVFVAPLRYGAGMKGKIGEAMTLGLPVVTTPVGAEGMGLVDGEHALVAEGPEAFAAAVVRLYEDAQLWARIAASARARAASCWSPAAMASRLDELLAGCVPAARRRSRSPRAVPAPPRPHVTFAAAAWGDRLSAVGIGTSRGALTLPEQDATTGGSEAGVTNGKAREGGGSSPPPAAPPAGGPAVELAPPSGTLLFTCNVCGAACEAVPSELRREMRSCMSCGSTVRFRAVVAALSTALFGEAFPLPAFPHRPRVRGLGCSDWLGYAAGLADKFDYRNTYYHTEPLLDLAKPVPAPLVRAHDFVICSDVLEHVPPPVETCVASLRDLLRPGGHLVLTVPYRLDGPTVEHFPELFDYHLGERDGRRVLVNRTRAGETQVFDDLVFHGGEGATLEMRLFSVEPLLAVLRKAGFSGVRVFGESVPEHGVAYDEAVEPVCSLPILATRR